MRDVSMLTTITVLLAAAAMPQQTSSPLPPPQLEFDDSVTYTKQPPPRPVKPRQASRWRAQPAPFRYSAPAPQVSTASGVDLRQGDILIDTDLPMLQGALVPWMRNSVSRPLRYR
jgi:hypothetical protein